MKFILVLADLSKATISGSTVCSAVLYPWTHCNQKILLMYQVFPKRKHWRFFAFIWNRDKMNIKWLCWTASPNLFSPSFSIQLTDRVSTAVFFSSLQLQKAKQKSLWRYIFSKKSQIFLLPLFFLLILITKCCFLTSGKILWNTRFPIRPLQHL